MLFLFNDMQISGPVFCNLAHKERIVEFADVGLTGKRERKILLKV